MISNEFLERLSNIIKENKPQEYIRIIEEENERLCEEIDKLEEKISKAIEFIINYNDKTFDSHDEIPEELYETLRGDNHE